MPEYYNNIHREEYKLQVPENKILRKILGPKKTEVNN
jgi:hypothetical protein